MPRIGNSTIVRLGTIARVLFICTFTANSFPAHHQGQTYDCEPETNHHFLSMWSRTIITFARSSDGKTVMLFKGLWSLLIKCIEGEMEISYPEGVCGRQPVPRVILTPNLCDIASPPSAPRRALGKLCTQPAASARPRTTLGKVVMSSSGRHRFSIVPSGVH